MPSSVPAPLWLRIAAIFYDLLVLTAVWMLAAALVLFAFHGDVDVVHQPPLYHTTLQGVLLALTAIYFVISWARGGQTIGMRAWRLRVAGADDRSPSWSQALVRFVVGVGSLGACGLGFVWCLIDSDRRAWHDLAAGTRVLRIPK
jgi:uncharacterized RDD family membrane protein YckC